MLLLEVKLNVKLFHLVAVGVVTDEVKTTFKSIKGGLLPVREVGLASKPCSLEFTLAALCACRAAWSDKPHGCCCFLVQSGHTLLLNWNK